MWIDLVVYIALLWAVIVKYNLLKLSVFTVFANTRRF